MNDNIQAHQLTKFERKILEYLFTHPRGATLYEIREQTKVTLATHPILMRFYRRMWIQIVMSGEHRIFKATTEGTAVFRRILAAERAK